MLIESISITTTKIRRLTEVEDANGAELISLDDLRKIYIGAAMPDSQTMSTINRQQNSLSRQLSKELCELMSLVNARKNATDINLDNLLTSLETDMENCCENN